MVLGEQVDGIHCQGWRFVTSDTHDIAGAVRRENPDARLVAHPGSGEIGVVEWFAREHMGETDLEAEAGFPINARGGCWYRSFDWRHNDGTPIKDEPDQRIVDSMRRLDNRKRGSEFSPAAYIAWCEQMQARSDEFQQKVILDHTREAAKRVVAQTQRLTGQKPRIIVPRGLSLGGR